MEKQYKKLMAEVAEALENGPLTTAELKKMFPDFPDWQVMNVIGYIGAVKVQGGSRYEPWTVYGPNDPAMPPQEIDQRIEAYFDLCGDPVTAGDLKAHLMDDCGFSKGAIDNAYTRKGVRAVKDGRRWVRTMAPVDEAVSPLDAMTPPSDEILGKSTAMRMLLSLMPADGSDFSWDDVLEGYRTFASVAGAKNLEKGERQLEWAFEAAGRAGLVNKGILGHFHATALAAQWANSAVEWEPLP